MPTLPAGFRGSFHTDFRVRAAYSEGAGPYRIIPRAVAVPIDIEDVCALVRHATTGGETLIPRGAGSGLPGNNIGPGIVVDMREFTLPLVVAPVGSANVGAAVTWAALDRAAAPFDLRLGPNPSSGAFCTLGGMVATNAAGARSLKAGSVRSWVRGVEMVTADGELGWFTRRREPRDSLLGNSRGLDRSVAASRRFQADVQPALLAAAPEVAARYPATRKNSSGYALDRYLATGDLVDLIVGSEGTLGIITRVELDLETLPRSTASVMLALGDLASLPDVIGGLAALEPSAIELMDRTLLRVVRARVPFPLTGVEAILLVDFERSSEGGAEAAANEARTKLEHRCVHFETAISREERERIWSLRHGASPALAALPPGRQSLQIIEDGCVPVAALGTYIEGVRTAAGRAGLEIVAFGHAGDGHLHVNILADTGDKGLAERLGRLLDDVTGLLARLGGTASGEHGDGRLRAPLLERLYGSTVVGLFEQVKKAFDPTGTFNPGVILSTPGSDPLSTLKVGEHASAIPADVEERLRVIEHTGGWRVAKTELAKEEGVVT